MGQSRRPRPRRLAYKLRQLRSQLGLTQEKLAAAINHIESAPQPGHISEFEHGKREPSLLFLLAVARLAGVSLELLVDDKLDLPRRLPANPQSGEFEKRPAFKVTSLGSSKKVKRRKD
jgi:transcriptional regulator with XRE-family HTH domain